MAVGCYTWRAQVRRQDLQAHYDRQASRIARQVELRLEHYRKLADSYFGDGEIRNHKLRAADCAIGPEPTRAAFLSNDRSAVLFPQAGPLAASNNGLGDGASPTRESAVASGVRPRAPCLRLSLSELFAGLNENRTLMGQERQFDEVALVDDTQAAIFGLSTTTRVRLQKLPESGDKKGGDKKDDELKELMIGGTEFRVFQQSIDPLRWTPSGVQRVPEVGPGPKLKICGLVRRDRLDADSHQINPAYFLWAVFLLAIGLLSLPLAKLWLIGRHARFRRFDAAQLLISTVLGAALGVVLLLGFFARTRMQLDLDARLQSAAKELGRRIEDTATRSASLLGAARVEDLQVCSKRTPQVESLFWLDDQGTARLPETDQSKSEVNLSDRDYFKRARAGDTEELARSISGSMLGAAEIVRSVDASEIALIVARAASFQDASRAASHGVLGIKTPLAELLDPILPLGFQTAVLDADGKVMLHSDNEAHHGDLFFDDLDDDRELRAVLMARLSEYLNFEYLGSRSRAYTMPINGNWSIVLIASTSLVDSPTRYMIVLTLGILATIASVLALGYLGLRIGKNLKDDVTRPDDGVGDDDLGPFRLFGPDARSSSRYLRGGTRALLGAAIVVGATFWATPGLPGYGALAAGAALVLGLPLMRMYRLYCANRRAEQKAPPGPRAIRWLSSVRVSYALHCAGLTTALVSTPAAVIFACVYDELSDSVTRADQDHLARQLRVRPECLQRERWHAASCRALVAYDVREPGGPDPETEAQTAGVSMQATLKAVFPDLVLDSPWLRPVQLVLDQLPPFRLVMSDAAGSLYRVRQTYPEKGGLAWSWRRDIDTLTLELAGTRRCARLSPMFDVERSTPELWLALALAAVIVFGVTFVAYRSLERLLFLKLLTPATPRSEPAITAPGAAQTCDPSWTTWIDCSSEERRILGQLAVDGYATPHPDNGPVLRELAKRDVLDPATLTIRSADLAKLVRKEFPNEKLDACEQQGGVHYWSLVRVPLSAGVGVLLLCFGFTQADLSAVGLTIPSALSLLPLLFRLLTRR